MSGRQCEGAAEAQGHGPQVWSGKEYVLNTRTVVRDRRTSYLSTSKLGQSRSRSGQRSNHSGGTESLGASRECVPFYLAGEKEGSMG